VGIEPIIAVGSQFAASPFFADLQAAAIREGQTEADVVRVAGWQQVNCTDQLATNCMGCCDPTENARHLPVSAWHGAFLVVLASQPVGLPNCSIPHSLRALLCLRLRASLYSGAGQRTRRTWPQTGRSLVVPLQADLPVPGYDVRRPIGRCAAILEQIAGWRYLLSYRHLDSPRERVLIWRDCTLNRWFLQGRLVRIQQVDYNRS
jgi:hypothetical protein